MSNIGWTNNPLYVPLLEKGLPLLAGATLEKIFKEGAAYLVKFPGIRRKAVLKAETVPSGVDVNELRFSIEQMAELYKAVTGGFTDLRLLKASELPMLESILPKETKKEQEFVNASITRNVIDGQERVGRPTIGLERVQRPTVVWYMMSVLDNLVNLFDACRDKPNDPQSKKAVALLERKPELWVELGRILVVDLFVGNFDRFGWNSKKKAPPDMQCWEIVNPGNIFFTFNENATDGSFRGIDFFDPNSPYWNVFRLVQLQEGTQKAELTGPWPGRLLHDGKGKVRDYMAETIMADIKKRFLEKVSVGVDLTKHQKKLREGMTEGRETLKKVLHAMKKRPMMPPGLKDRLMILGWK